LDLKGQSIEDLFMDVLNESVVLPSDIPDIDLYIDQITTLFEDKIKDSKRSEDDKLITKTMVNNYSKAGLIKPIKGKKYSKEHIIQMLIIYQMKQIISIGDIKCAFDFCKSDESSLINTYTEFVNKKQLRAEKADDVINSLIAAENGSSRVDDKLLLVMTLCSMSNYFKRMAEKIIDSCSEQKIV